jgi:hypothetical protein
MREFVQNIVHDLIPILGMEILLHSAERNANNIAMMHLRSGVLVADLQPHFVHEVDIFRPKPWRCGPRFTKAERLPE